MAANAAAPTSRRSDPSASHDGCRNKDGAAKFPLVEELQPGRDESIEAVLARGVVRLEVRFPCREWFEACGVGPFCRTCRSVTRLAAGSEQLEAAIELTPGLTGVEYSDRHHRPIPEIAAVLRAGVRQEVQLERVGVREVSRIDVRATAGRGRRNRAQNVLFQNARHRPRNTTGGQAFQRRGFSLYTARRDRSECSTHLVAA